MKSTNICLFFFFSLIFACTSEPSVEEKITQAQEAYTSNPNDSTAQVYINLLLENLPADDSLALTYLSQAAGAFQKSSDKLTTGSRKDLLLKMKAHAPAISNGMEALSKRMYNEEKQQIEQEAAKNYIATCEVYAQIQPDDRKTPVFLFKAAETARAMRNYGKAIELYDDIYQNYPDFDKHPQTLFLKAFTLDNDLKRHDEARALYEQFLKKYPENDFADDTEFLLSNLGKSDEEIIQKFEQEKE